MQQDGGIPSESSCSEKLYEQDIDVRAQMDLGAGFLESRMKPHAVEDNGGWR